VDADKRDAAQVFKDQIKKSIPESIVNEYKKANVFAPADKELVDIREKIYASAEKSIKCVSPDKRIFTLTAPTGSGKTLAVLNVAIRLREKIRNQRPCDRHKV
jgi:CRISPR-associated endonuclease/helicase Cas3